MTGSALACSSFWWSARWIWSIRFARCYHFDESYCQLIFHKKWLLSTLLSTVVTANCACIRNANVCFFPMHASQVGQHFNLCPNFELRKWLHYPIIPTGMQYNIKGRWQPGHQCESFHWSIIIITEGQSAKALCSIIQWCPAWQIVWLWFSFIAFDYNCNNKALILIIYN